MIGEIKQKKKNRYFASGMIKANNAGLLQRMIANNENKELLLSQIIKKQKICKSQELAEKTQPSLDLFLRNYSNSKNDNEDDEIKADFK